MTPRRLKSRRCASICSAAYSRHFARNAAASSLSPTLPNFFSTTSSIGRPWQSQPGTYGASKPESSFDFTTMSFSTLFTAWPMWIWPLAYGDRRATRRWGGPSRAGESPRTGPRLPSARACAARAWAGRRASGIPSRGGGCWLCNRAESRASLLLEGGQEVARLFGIAVHLRNQRGQVGERQFVAQARHEFDGDALAVQVAIEVEQMRFEQGLDAGDGRARAEAGDRSDRLRFDAMHARGVDALQRRALVAVAQVRRRIAERAAELLAAHH